MLKFKFLAALFCLLAIANQVNAQLVIRNSGHAELGVNPSSNDLDTVTTLKIFGDIGTNKAGGRITFGDSTYVAIGEYGMADSDKMWLHGKNGIYITKGTGTLDTIAFFDPSLSTNLNVNSDILAHGVLIQSDERYKENIVPVDDVLNSLLILEPVTYQLKSHRTNGQFNGLALAGKNSHEAETMNRYYQNLDQGSERYGFLAQNVKEAFPQLVHTDANGMMSVDYIGLIPILVQSINELQAELAELKAEKQEEEEVAPMFQAPQQSANDELEASLKGAKLYQNAPNPWNSETVIRYSLPEDVKRADIYIYNMQGMQLKCIPAQGRGESQVTLTASNLNAGMYLYALVADGALIDSKQMILTR
jgi:hypothetical protein